MGEHQRQVLAASAQGWQLEVMRPQPIIEVFTKCARLHVLLHRMVGGHHHARSTLPRAVRPEGIVGALLQQAQQFDLRDRRQVANLIQKQGAIFGTRDQALAGAVAPR